jgi:hypothetical protein
VADKQVKVADKERDPITMVQSGNITFLWTMGNLFKWFDAFSVKFLDMYWYLLSVIKSIYKINVFDESVSLNVCKTKRICHP